MVNKDDRRYLNSSTTTNHQYLAMGFTTCHQEAPLEHDRAVIRCRRLAARLLGQLFVHYDQQQSCYKLFNTKFELSFSCTTNVRRNDCY